MSLIVNLDKLPSEERGDIIRSLEKLSANNVNSLDQLIKLIVSTSCDKELILSAIAVSHYIKNKDSLTQALIQSLTVNTDAEILWHIGSTLGLLEDPKWVSDIVVSLSDNSSLERRKSAAYILGSIGDETAIKPLVEKLLDKSEVPDVRASVAEALGSIRSKAAYESIVHSLKDESVQVRFWSAYALGQIGDRRAIPHLQYLIDNDDGVLEEWGSIKNEAQGSINQINEIYR